LQVSPDATVIEGVLNLQTTASEWTIEPGRPTSLDAGQGKLSAQNV